MPGRAVLGRKYVGHDVPEREVRHRVPAGLVQQYDVLAVGDPVVAEPDPHPPPQRLGVQHPLGQLDRYQESSDRTVASGPCCQDRPITRLRSDQWFAADGARCSFVNARRSLRSGLTAWHPPVAGHLRQAPARDSVNPCMGLRICSGGGVRRN